MFYDIVKNMTDLDNENTDLDQEINQDVTHNVDEIEKIKKDIANIKSIEKLLAHFKSNESWSEDDNVIDLFTERRLQIEAEAEKNKKQKTETK